MQSGTINFIKMHGLGNDFVIIDERHSPMQLVDPDQRARMVQALAARRTGIGCDQLAVLRPSGRADCYMQIYNNDGTESAACGNVTRCVGWLLMREKHSDAALIDTEAGLLETYLAGAEQVRVNMGIPRLDWNDIPLAHAEDTRTMPPKWEGLGAGVCVSMGNPHIVFFVDDAQNINLPVQGACIENDPLFPDRVNVSLAQITSSTSITLRVWERGAGETLACGTGACATHVAARLRGLVERNTTVCLPGGELRIEWAGTAENTTHPVWMSGAVATSFTGQLGAGQWW